MSSRSVIDLVVRQFLDPPLTAAGFKRKARRWNRPKGDLLHVVEVQGSQWNEVGNESFAINLGVFSALIYRIVWQKEPPSVVKEVDCMIRCRLAEGMLEEGARAKERWWSILASTDSKEVGKEAADLVQSRGIEYLDRVVTMKEVHDLLQGDIRPQAKAPLGRIYLAAVKAELGDLEGAQGILNEVSKRAPKAWRSRVAAVVQELSTK